ncbi:hypothetical protein KKH18_14515 [bacterium]|nr:hypothetical protein [bacterium]
MKYLILLLNILLLTGCTAEKKADHECPGTCSRKTHELLHANLWMQTSAEYTAVCMQTYGTAQALLPVALADSSWTACIEQGENYAALPPAIVLDVDETVLDNTAFESRLILTNDHYRKENWIPWCNEAKAPAMAGVKEFLVKADELGVAIFYLTNRGSDVEEATRENLIKEGLPFDTEGDHLLTKGEKEDWGSDKGSRRKHIAETHRVIMLFGDNFNDFAPETQVSPEARVDLAVSYADRWGTKWFMLPNPDYGDWEAAFYGYKWPETDKEQLEIKYKALKTLEAK